ncbi:hypothetical protein MASR2M78_11610 [Treponema sp.]
MHRRGILGQDSHTPPGKFPEGGCKIGCKWKREDSKQDTGYKSKDPNHATPETGAP